MSDPVKEAKAMFNLLESAAGLIAAGSEDMENHEKITWDAAACRWLNNYDTFMRYDDAA